MEIQAILSIEHLANDRNILFLAGITMKFYIREFYM